ncbi:RNA methyltransferase [Thiorhodovibrio frisius]|uniref:tRNA (cytidine/uridine-2'-O-)-methyltransferase TrmJ n=1 Tax=Thiorhodovibrio frisius TaxID=631362 RepID=H8Z1L0_9GAMM|nr:RNA methyltransferase [Thiorhodovibrio frisius]EIC21455.1 RNA methyltransferase, TrmH family, group 1 [Thiorhodovibrio frisius]WPL24041.1 tRNA (cytidine/uridine-2'-O-)-methyltransferase TrmJ [Thiorhodovibrio frisius]
MTNADAHADSEALGRIRFVLVETSLTGNQGAVARAMKTMGLDQLALVNPRRAPDAEALARAVGADDLLQRAPIHPTLPEALGDCRLVIGASARRRAIEWPLLSPADAARKLLAEAAEGPVALVLGRESSGLSNEELAHCHYLTQIPANPAFSSLNLAAAAQVFAYEIRQAWLAATTADMPATSPADEGAHEPASAEEMAGFFEHLRETLVLVGFAKPEQSHKLLRRLRRLFNRARPDRTEINILRGMLKALGRHANS